MKKAIWSAFLAAVPMLCGAMDTGGEGPAIQDQQPAAQAPAAAGKDAGAKTPAPASLEAGDPPKLAGPPSTAAQAVDEKTFVIGPEDQLEILVWADPRIGGNFLVRPDGKISMSLLGEVQAAGRTPAELSNDIGEMLKQREILRRPQVNVKVLQVNSKKFSINGEVVKTGAFPLVVPTRVMDALVNAGGFKDFANKKDIVIIRGDKRLKFNWNDVVKGKKTEQNVYLEPGDIIIVK